MPTNTDGLREERERRVQEINSIDKRLKKGFWGGMPSKQEADKLINERAVTLEEINSIDRQIANEESKDNLSSLVSKGRREEGML